MLSIFCLVPNLGLAAFCLAFSRSHSSGLMPFSFAPGVGQGASWAATESASPIALVPDSTSSLDFALRCSGVRLVLYKVGVGHEEKALPLVRRTEITGRQTCAHVA